MSFEQALVASGLRPRAIVPDGRWRRCATDDKPRKRNGAYVLHPDGRGYWRNWALDAELNSYTDGAPSRAPQIDFAAIKRQQDAARAKRVAAIRAARDFWQRCQPLRAPHPYIARKGLSQLGCAGLRTHGDRLIVPVLWGDRITSLQSITPEGEKRFWPGAPVKAGAYVLDRPNAALTVVCEGLATGLAIYQSVRHARVIVAFDAGNLAPVVERLRPTGSVVIAADDDHGTEARRGTNPGREKAAAAAALIGAGVAWPEGAEGTDFCDLLAEVGPGGAKRVERLVVGRARYVT